LLHEPKQNIAAVVDPAEAEPVLKNFKNWKGVGGYFNTHHHNDHVWQTGS